MELEGAISKRSVPQHNAKYKVEPEGLEPLAGKVRLTNLAVHTRYKDYKLLMDWLHEEIQIS